MQLLNQRGELTRLREVELPRLEQHLREVQVGCVRRQRDCMRTHACSLALALQSCVWGGGCVGGWWWWGGGVACK